MTSHAMSTVRLLGGAVSVFLVLVVGHAGPASAQSERAGASDSGRTSAVAVGPRAVSLTFGQSQQFTATDSGGGTVTWSVDGVVGGSAALGTVSDGGLYVAPRTVGAHTVAAKSATGPAVGATVYVTNMPGVFTYHNDLARTGQNLQETVLSPSTVKTSSFGKLFSYRLDGLTFSTPLYAQNVELGGSLGRHNVVFVATEHDTVYAFDADGGSSTPLWQRSFIDPAHGVTTVPAADTGETSDIPKEIGITSTPVIDPATSTMYVVAKTKEVSGGKKAYVQRLHAIDIRTGLDRATSPSVVIKASVRGTGRSSVGGRVAFNPLHANQRAALTLVNGIVYVAFSSHHGGAGPFHGWLLGYGASDLRQTMVFSTTPNGYEGGIWMNGCGLGVDSRGALYAVTGNGLFDADKGGSDFGDSFLKLSASGKVLDYFTPKNEAALDGPDLDLGSGGVLLLPDQRGPHRHEAVTAGKDRTIFLVDRDNMGRHHARVDQVVQSIPNAFKAVFPRYAGGNFSSPVYFNGRVYFAAVSDQVRAFSLSNGRLSTKPTSTSAALFGGRGGTLSISAASATDKNGILWALQYRGAARPGRLHAYLASDLRTELWNSDQAGRRDTLRAWNKFSLPTVANGKVYVASVTLLTVYGLLPTASLR